MPARPSYHTVSLPDRRTGLAIKLFYREAGSQDDPVVLLLHGFPTSSHQYRGLTTTDPSGDFLIAGILPGLYSMQVQREGFAAIHVTGLTLRVGESRQFLIKLRVGAVEQTVEVDASGQSMNTEDAQMTTVVGSLLVHELPLNVRSFQDLIAMKNGVG